MLDEKNKLREVLDIGLEVTQIKDLDILLERILTKARHFTNADAGHAVPPQLPASTYFPSMESAEQ